MSNTVQNGDSYSYDPEPYTPNTYEDFCPNTTKDQDKARHQGRREEDYNVTTQESINTGYREMPEQPGAESNTKSESMENFGGSKKKKIIMKILAWILGLIVLGFICYFFVIYGFGR